MNITLKLSYEARKRVKDNIEAWRAMGSRSDLRTAADLQVLLDIHDQVHGIK